MQAAAASEFLPAPHSHIHVAGIGGVGMNAIAQVLQAQGYRVTGSDRMADQGVSTAVLRKLTAMGIPIFAQNGSGITSDTGALVVSTAIEPDNPDLMAAAARRVPVLHRATALSAAIAGQSCIAIAGTSGKTTVTGMVGWLLTELGVHPNVVNGGALLNWQDESAIGNVRITGSNWWVVEVDESDRSLLRFHPEWALLTNISKDHFSLDETRELFGAFCAQVRTGLVVDADTAAQLPRSGRISARICRWDPQAAEALPLPLPGAHNRLNAALAVTFCEAFGYDRQAAIECLRTFQGLERRLQRVSSPEQIPVYDDYAHNPAKIAAAWRAVQQIAPRVRGVWRPHGYGPLAAMADDLAAMFVHTLRPGDQLCILPVYYAGGTARATYTAESFVKQLQEQGVPALYVADYEELRRQFLTDTHSTEAYLCMGARDPALPEFARDLARRLASQGL